ncbi:MAG: hypothetical protein M3Q68_08505 [Actinomycetota bacterium]|nr:hypothetical protein [Actinomycetota bacterium]
MDLVTSYRQLVALYVRARWGQDSESGASLVGYALLVALIAIVCILAIVFLFRPTSSI